MIRIDVASDFTLIGLPSQCRFEFSSAHPAASNRAAPGEFSPGFDWNTISSNDAPGSPRKIENADCARQALTTSPLSRPLLRKIVPDGKPTSL